MNLVLALQYSILLTFKCGTLFEDLFMFFCLMFCYAFVCVCLIVLCGKGLTSWLSFVVSNCVSLSHWYPGSGLALDCIDS